MAGIGALGFIGIGKETAWGTAPGTRDAYMPFVNESLELVKNQIVDPSIRARRDESPNYEGANQVQGQITAEVNPDVLGWLLYSALGDVTTQQQGATAAYRHTFKPTQVAFDPKCFLKPLTFEVHRDLGNAFNYSGCVVNQLQLSCGINQMEMRATATILGKTAATGAATVPAWAAGQRPFLWNELGVTIGGASFTELQSFELNINNNMQVLHALNQSKEPHSILPNGHLTVELATDVIMLDQTEYTKFVNQTEQAFTFTFEGDTIADTYKYQCIITLPKVRYVAFPIGISGAGNIIARVSGRAKFDVTTSKTLEIVVQNAEASY